MAVLGIEVERRRENVDEYIIFHEIQYTWCEVGLLAEDKNEMLLLITSVPITAL